MAAPSEIAAALCDLGGALLGAGEVSAAIGRTIAEVGSGLGVDARSFTVPTGLFVRVDVAGKPAAVDFGAAAARLRLDQVYALYALTDRLRSAPQSPADISRGVRQVARMPRKLGWPAIVTGHVLLTIGFGLVLLRPTLQAVPAYAVAGLAVGTLIAVARRLPVLDLVLPVLAALMVTAAAIRLAGPLTGEDPAHLLIPPLVVFLPGRALTTGAIELAGRAPLAGVTWVAAGLWDLLLLALGTLAGVAVGAPEAPVESAKQFLGPWSPWAGLVILALGYMLYQAIPVRTLPWVLAVLLAERFAELAGTAIAEAPFGAFTAGLLLPAATWVVSRRAGFPSAVIFLPSFWMLVPGALGLTATLAIFRTRSAGNITDLVTSIIVVLALTLGIMVGSRLLPGNSQVH
jgi:uncharacterized membrane protein YjjP (DUF1212 family)/uncharacterized membrane protein YjjB (DUF3815 family)